MLVFWPPGCYSLGLCVQFDGWRGGVEGVDYDLERPSVSVSPTLSSPNQSNTVTPAPSESQRDLLENATDSLKSSGEITTLFTRPRGTCAKSSSCTSLCTGPLKARAEPVSECAVCVWMGCSQICWSSAFKLRFMTRAKSLINIFPLHTLITAHCCFLGESYQAYQVRTPRVTQEMWGETLKGDRCCSPRGNYDKLQEEIERDRVWKIHDIV